MIQNEIIEAGARVIFKRTLRISGMYPQEDLKTRMLASMCLKFAHQITLDQIDRWVLVAMAKPGLTETQRKTMRYQARAANDILTQVQVTQ